MNIQISTDNHIDGSERLSSYVNEVVQEAVSDFNTQITHIGVHFSDQNSSKVGYEDKRCVLEYRIAGRTGAAVSHDANSIDEALLGAIEKVRHSIEHALGKMKQR